MDGQSPASRAAQLIDYWTPLLIRMSVDAGIIEAFGREERSPLDVAAATSTNPDAVARVVRALASRGVFAEAGDGLFRLTVVGRCFLEGERGGIVGLATFKGYEIHAWAEAPHTLRTGAPSFPEHFGQGFWEWLVDHPSFAAHFNSTMRRRTSSLLDVALPLMDWPDEGTVVDVGGGNGVLMERLLERRAGSRGVIFDLPHVVEEAARRLGEGELSDRVEFVGGDFLEEVPAGHDVYVMASVLHDWDDERATRILSTCRRAMARGSRLILFEAVLAPGTEPDLAKLMDLHMMVLFGAKERTRADWERLLEGGGFVLTRIVPTPSLAWIEASPAS